MESLMHQISFSVSWKNPKNADTHEHDPKGELRFDIRIDEGQPYVESAKQFMVGAVGRGKSRILKDNYLTPEQHYNHSNPDYSNYHMNTKTEDLPEAKRRIKAFMQEKYEAYVASSQAGLASIMAYDPEAAI